MNKQGKKFYDSPIFILDLEVEVCYDKEKENNLKKKFDRMS